MSDFRPALMTVAKALGHAVEIAKNEPAVLQEVSSEYLAFIRADVERLEAMYRAHNTLRTIRGGQ